MLKSFLADEKGMTLTEYITLLGGIILVAVVGIVIYNG
jgi:Flp pilus assembly pilin Flp